VQEPTSVAGLEPVVRGLTAAAKALRLYPASSPIPRQAVDSAAASLAGLLVSEPVLCLKVVRDGLAWAGTTVAPGAPGASDLADSLRDHGVAEVDFTPGVSSEDLLSFLAAVMEKPEDIRSRGGLAAVIQAAGVEAVRVAEVSLTVVDAFGSEMDTDTDGFLRELATDPDRVSAWLGVAAKGDPASLATGLDDLARAAGEGNLQALLDSLRTAMGSQDGEIRDSLVGVALDPGGARDLLGRVFGQMPPSDLAKTLCGGTYGRNMLSMSTALTRLPLADRMSEVLSQVQALLPASGRTPKEIAFLEHMLDARSRAEAELPLATSQPAYSKVAELARIDPAHVAGARDEVGQATLRTDSSAVSMMLTLLDQQSDYRLYCETLDSLAGMVPLLIERGNLSLAARVVTELATRESRTQQPWPDLAERLRNVIAEATSRRSMKALIAAVAADPMSLDAAREMMRRSGDSAGAAFIDEALVFKPDGLAVAERIVGRRIVDMLSSAAARVQWFQVAPLVARLAREADARALQAIEALSHRTDAQSRREVAAGLAAAGGPTAQRALAPLLRDASAEVAVAAVRAAGKSDAPGTAKMLGSRLDELDLDGKDFDLGREIIGALSRTTDPSATAILEQLSRRRALIKRGHFTEVQDLVRQALSQRASGGGRP
jgi:hypothetical protein